VMIWGTTKVSDEFRSIEDKINRLVQRKEKILGVAAELKQVVAEIDTDVMAMRLQLDSLRFEGDSANKPDKEKPNA
jgi:DNA integrity scanning protein DisA with diadenylate cyclase activity